MSPDELRTVAHHDCDALAGPDAEIEQPVGCTLDIGEDLLPGVGLVAELEPHRVRVLLDSRADHVLYGRMCTCHRTLLDLEHVVLDAQSFDDAALAHEDALLEPLVPGVGRFEPRSRAKVMVVEAR